MRLLTLSIEVKPRKGSYQCPDNSCLDSNSTFKCVTYGGRWPVLPDSFAVRFSDARQPLHCCSWQPKAKQAATGD